MCVSNVCLQVRHLYICDFHKNFIQSVRNKRKRKTSDDGGESPEHDVEVPEVTMVTPPGLRTDKFYFYNPFIRRENVHGPSIVFPLFKYVSGVFIL